ncbi:tetratricopeptide repeat protein [Plebeiibacterium sediminum]|uniref:Tetratricopeptide repeat protein n=1 Tax=Plebeiibacterium sediminum TaxID=2992112 RepID=A0AAE3M6T5_9BACT|nr:tetratricopeptide repeat protein [Plebeiobacterium sediminum]MCW3787645.1 tetratricopeptide repeat protein [Plebeiobacterium sediminum]
MKNILSVGVLLFALIATTFAQDEKSAAEWKNDGNAALKSKDYKTALASYEAAIKNWDEAEEMDAAMVYNTATCARKLNKNELSIKYYNQSIDLDYKADISTYYIGKAYKEMDKMGEMEKVLLAGIKDYATSKYVAHMKKELAIYYVKDANDYFSKGVSLLNTRTDANRDQWDAIKGKAKVEFDKAVELANKALEFQATNEAAKTIVTKSAELMNS